MKKIKLLPVLIILCTVILAPKAKADFSYRVSAEEVIGKLNIVITHPETKDKYLLYLGSGCGYIEKNQYVTLNIRGNLDESYDSIKTDSIHNCNIVSAEKFHEKIYVKYVYSSNTRARVVDEEEREYYMIYNETCSAMNGYRRNYVYTFQGDDDFTSSDRVVFPNNDGHCSINYVQEIGEKTMETEAVNQTSSDIKSPTMVTHVRAFARNNRVFLSWRASRDDEGIDHYIVSYSNYNINTEDVPFIEMPNQMQTRSTHYSIGDLLNNETYYFYVLAVDKAGNVSSEWSREVSATPKASVLNTKSTGEEDINIQIKHESDKSFLIKWTPVAGARHTVLFNADGKREFSRTEYPRSYIRILKRDHRKGKRLSLEVRAYDYRGIAGNDEIYFDF